MQFTNMLVKGQQTYGHPHQMSGGWMPSHMAGMEQSGNMMAPSHAHPMYTVNHQPLSHMYYELDNSIAISSASTSHHIGEHQPLASQPHNQLSLATSQANLPAKLVSGAETNRSKQSSPTPTGSPNSIDAADSSNPKSHSTPMTLKWLNDNYEVAEGVCIPRSTLYQHYIEFCEGRDLNPVNAASFGKIIRQQFPQITTRRLGTRGQSKYHYYGIGVKEQSPYYDYVYSKAGLQSVNTAKKEAPKQAPVQAYSPRSKMGTLLPEFPDIDELKLPEDIESDKLLTFIMMYRTHCQRILDTVIRANFDEVQNFLLHFWQGMPAHMTAILGVGPVVGMVAVCDTILYKAVCNVLMPHVLQPLPESLTMVIKKFAKQLEDWISEALSNLPQSLKDMKLKLARKFSRILRLQMSLNHLCQASRSVVSSSDIMSQMLDDWQAIERGVIIKQTQLTLCQKDMIAELSQINQFYDEFENLLQEQSSIESFIEWLDKIIEESIIKASDNTTGSVKRKSQSFLLVWSAFSTKIIRDMTLHSAPSFGSFHLLHLMFDDYILYHLEHMCCSELSDEILADIRGTPKVSSISRETILQSKSVEKHDMPGQVSSPIEGSDITADAGKEGAQKQQPGFVTSSHVELLSQLTESVHTTNGEKTAGETTSGSTTSTTSVRSSSVSAPATSAPVDSNNSRLPRTRAPNAQTGSVPFYAPEMDSVDQTWRLAQQSNVNYQGGENFNVSTEAGGDILYYAVNSMNLPPESSVAQTESASPAMTSRVTFDPADAQEALNRSFQPFTQHMYPGSDKASKRRAEQPVALPTKRYHGEGDGDREFEVNAGDYVHT